jgi:hypothetical protein
MRSRPSTPLPATDAGPDHNPNPDLLQGDVRATREELMLDLIQGKDEFPGPTFADTFTLTSLTQFGFQGC